MRLIDADALQKEYQKEHGKRLLLIDVAPTIDAVKVVRCKDCKYADLCDGQYRLCLLTGTWKKFDHFCSDGERKEDDER